MDWKKSEYTKVIGIKNDKMILIEKIRGKKSRAGKLDEIIEYYIQEKLNKKIC